ncbi:MAG TPA: VOC family protein [Steroidobacteraceae bacterium]|nr:VOC family protein [Steroidobacteraceae bacterium]
MTRTRAAWMCACALVVGWSALAPAADEGKVVGLSFVGRMVGDLDASVAFYKAIGFSQDPAASSAWRKDDVVEHLYGVRGVETRMAKMFVNNEATAQRFVVYLRELRGLERKNMAEHTAWEPGATHFGLVVPDAAATWAKLKASGLLRARSWGGELIAPPGQTKGMLAYMTDPDGLDIEIIDRRPAAPAENGRPARPAFVPGVSHVGLIVLDAAKARAFYETLFGGQLQGSADPPWLQGDFYDSAVGGHGNVLRFFNESFTQPSAPGGRMNLELVDFQNRKKPVERYGITDIGVGYLGFEVEGLDAFLPRVKAAGAKMVSDGIVTMRSGTREVMVRDPDVGAFVELFEHPKK